MNFKSFINTFLLFIFLLTTIGCVSTKASKISDPVVVGSIKEGITTKSDIRRLFGDPQSISKHNNNYDGRTESWSYSHRESKGYRKSFLRSAGGSVVGNLIPSGMGIGTRAVFKGTRSVANKVVSRGADKVAGNKGTYSLTIDFKDNVVINKRFSGSGSHAVVSSLNTVSNNRARTQTKKKTNTIGNTPVYTTYNSKTFHKKNCSEIANVDTVKFQSSEEIIKAGGNACTLCKPY